MTKTRPSSQAAADSIVLLGGEAGAVAADNARETTGRETGDVLHPAPVSGHPPEALQLLERWRRDPDYLDSIRALEAPAGKDDKN